MLLQNIIAEIDLYYKSGNDVSVERAAIPREKWEALKEAIEEDGVDLVTAYLYGYEKGKESKTNNK